MTKKRDKAELAHLTDPYLLARSFLADGQQPDGFYHVVGDMLGKHEIFATIRKWRGDYYHWRDVCYHRITDATVRVLLTSYLQSQQVSLTGTPFTISASLIRDVLLNLDALVHIEETVELGTWLDGTARAHAIPMRNGLLSLEGFQEGRPPTLLEHTPGYFTLTCLPFNYEPDAKCIAWLTFLREALNGSEEYVALFQEWLGYLFRPDLQLQKFMLISGDGATGKTTALTVVEALLGKDNVSHIPLSRFGQRFALAAMAGKVANITSESSHLVEEEGENMLKAVVSGDAVEVERKYQEAFTMTPTAKIMIACNTLPRFSDKTQGVWRRVLLFPFDHVVPEDRQVRGLAESIIEEELAGVFIWALDGLRQLNRNRRFTIPAASVAMTEQYRRESDSARAFLIDNYIYSPNGAGQLCEEVYAAYRRWCETNGCQPISQLHFGRSVHRVFPDAERVRPGGSGRRPWVYRGLVASQESGVWSQQS